MSQLDQSETPALKAEQADVNFLHYGDMTNIGDYLSSPRHYFNFACERKAVIVGGGASNNFFAKRALGKPGIRVAWGIGQSWPFGRKPSPFDQYLKTLLRRLAYHRASTRDRSLASPALPLVPCASVFHPIVDLPPGEAVSVIVNGNPRVSGDVEALRQQFLGKRAEYQFATNTLSIEDFMRIFVRAGIVITNSYHAAYWGLLSGRQVHIIGYSTKFTSVAALFDYPPSVVSAVTRGDGVSLADAILGCADRRPLQVGDPLAVRRHFRRLNLEFAHSLSEVGITVTLKRDGSAPAVSISL